MVFPDVSTRHLILLTILTSLCFGLQLIPRPPNVEFTSLIVFLVGAIFNVYVGTMLGFFVMLFNGFFSPWGFAGIILPFQIFGMMLLGFSGGLYGKARNHSYTPASSLEVAVIGAFLTLIYDLLTHFGFALGIVIIGTPLIPALVSVIISGALFSAVHIISNVAVFGLSFFPIIKTIHEFLGGEKS